MPRPSSSLSPVRALRRTAVAAALALGAVATLPGAASAAEPAPRPPVKPIPSLDVQRYLGAWHQIASIPQWFEGLCLSDTIAVYSLNTDGTVRVSNRCKGPLGLNVATKGRARILDPATNAQLQVTFVPLGGGNWFYPGDEPNYVIVGLGANYDWAVVGDPQRTSAFILSRKPTLTTEQRAAVTAALVGTGFNPCRLRVTKQRGGAQKAQSFCTAS